MTIKKRGIRWINALTGEVAVQMDGMRHKLPDANLLWWDDSADRITALGFHYTATMGRHWFNERTWFVDPFMPEGGYWNYQTYSSALDFWWGIKEGDLQPVRMNQRDDGVGRGENHPRMSPWGTTATSVAGLRIMGNNTYR